MQIGKFQNKCELTRRTISKTVLRIFSRTAWTGALVFGLFLGCNWLLGERLTITALSGAIPATDVVMIDEPTTGPTHREFVGSLESSIRPNSIQDDTDAGDSRSSEEDEPILSCEISPAKMSYQVGETPVFHVRIRNLTDEAFYLVGSVDASDCAWRYPHCYYVIEGPEGYKPFAFARCGNMNRLRPNDFVQVAPGETFDPYQATDEHAFFGNYQLSNHTFSMPGLYRFQFTYSTNATEFDKWQGDLGSWPEDEVRVLWEQVPKADVISNEVFIEVIE